MVDNNFSKHKLIVSMLCGSGRWSVPDWVPTQSARLYTHLEVGRNKLVRVTARTGVSGKLLTNSPETPPRAMRLDGLIPAYIRARHSRDHIEMTLFDRPVYNDERRAWEP